MSGSQVIKAHCTVGSPSVFQSHLRDIRGERDRAAVNAPPPVVVVHLLMDVQRGE